MISWKYALRSSSGQSLPIYKRLLSISITSFNCFFSFLNSLAFYSHLFTASQYTYIIFKWLLYLQSVLYFVSYVVSYLTCFMSSLPCSFASNVLCLMESLASNVLLHVLFRFTYSSRCILLSVLLYPSCLTCLECLVSHVFLAL